MARRALSRDPQPARLRAEFDPSGDAEDHRRWRAISAVETFSALYRLQGLRRIAVLTFANMDAVVLPTAPTVYSTAQVLANPIELNSRLGTYTNFVNLLDLCGLALPAAMRPDGVPFGVTLLGPAGRDAMLASIGRVFHGDTKLNVGATGVAQPRLAPLPPSGGDDIPIAVVGAHLSGMALNGELKALSGRLIEATRTAPDYMLYALDTTPPKPGMLRVEAGKGAAIELEIWSLSASAFGKFVHAIPPPLSIGTVKLADGRCVKGFVVEPEELGGAHDITAHGGWRAFMAAVKGTETEDSSASVASIKRRSRSRGAFESCLVSSNLRRENRDEMGCQKASSSAGYREWTDPKRSRRR